MLMRYYKFCSVKARSIFVSTKACNYHIFFKFKKDIKLKKSVPKPWL